MQTNYYFLRQLAPVLAQKLVGLKLMECFSQEKEEMVIGFAAARGIKSNYKQFFIRISVKPEFPCLYLTKEYRRANKNTVDLWSDIYDLEVKSVSVFENERAINIELEENINIVIKLFGNRSNILVFEKEDIKWVFNQSLKLDFGLKFSALNRPINQSFSAFKDENENYKKLFPTFGKIVNHYLDQKFSKDLTANQKWAEISEVIKALESPKYFLSKIDGSLNLILLPIGEIHKEFEDVIEASNATFIYGIKEKQADKIKSENLRIISREIKHIDVWIAQNSVRLEELQNGSRNEEIGHLLMSNLHQIASNTEKVELDDYYHNKKIWIKLKKDLTPQKNAENYYRKARNEKKEIENLEQNLKSKLSRKEYLIKKGHFISEIENIKELRKEISEFATLKPLEKNKKAADYFKVRKIGGFEIWIGKNAKNNDLLTLKFAKKDDIWLHARDVSGSHVVIKAQAGQKVPDYVIEKAAAMAAWNSKRKNDSLTPVIVTPKKFVRKIKGSAEGQMLVEKETVVMVKPEDISDS